MTTEIALIGLIAVMLVLQRWKERDVAEQIELAKRETQRTEQARCSQLMNNAFTIYSKAVVEGFRDADYANDEKAKLDEKHSP